MISKVFLCVNVSLKQVVVWGKLVVSFLNSELAHYNQSINFSHKVTLNLLFPIHWKVRDLCKPLWDEVPEKKFKITQKEQFEEGLLFSTPKKIRYLLLEISIWISFWIRQWNGFNLSQCPQTKTFKSSLKNLNDCQSENNLQSLLVTCSYKYSFYPYWKKNCDLY